MLKNILQTAIISTFIIVVESFANTTLSLQECVQAAQDKGSAVQQAEQELKVSKAQKSAAYTHWFPSVSAQATALQSYDYLVKMNNASGNLPVYNGDPATLAAATQYAYMPASNVGLLDRMGVAMVSVSQPIYMGGRISNGNELAEIGVEVSRLRLDMARAEATEQTVDRYIELVALHAKMNTLKAQNQFLDTLTHDVSLAFRRGFATSRDTLDLFLRKQESTIHLSGLEDGIALAEADLCRSLDGYCSGALTLSDSLSIHDNPQALRVDHNAVLSKRNEAQLMGKSVEAQSKQSSLHQGELLPQIIVGAAVMETGDFKASPTSNALVYANMSIPISGIWENVYRAQEDKAKEEQAQLKANETLRLLHLEMDKSWNDLTNAWRELELAKLSLEKEDRAIADTRLSFANGMEKAADLVQAQLRLQSSKEAEINARKNYLRTRAHYLRTTGRAYSL